MFSHIVIGSNNLDASRKFYDAIFSVLGAGAALTDAKGRLVYNKDGLRFLVTNPINGRHATCANGGTIGFNIQNSERVAAWHAAGTANGGTSAEEPPGVREIGGNRFYLAYLRDPDGNKLCGRCALL